MDARGVRKRGGVEAKGAGPVDRNAKEASRGRLLRPDLPHPGHATRSSARERARGRRSFRVLTGAAAPDRSCVERGSRPPSSMPRLALRTVATTAPDIFGAGGETDKATRRVGTQCGPQKRIGPGRYDRLNML